MRDMVEYGQACFFFKFFFKYPLRIFGPMCRYIVRLRQSVEDSNSKDC